MRGGWSLGDASARLLRRGLRTICGCWLRESGLSAMSACRMIDRGGRAVMTVTIFAVGAGLLRGLMMRQMSECRCLAVMAGRR